MKKICNLRKILYLTIRSRRLDDGALVHRIGLLSKVEHVEDLHDAFIEDLVVFIGSGDLHLDKVSHNVTAILVN